MGSLALKILAEHAGLKRVEPGDVVVAKVDAVMVNDVTGPLAVKVLEEAGASCMVEVGRRRTRIYVVLDHYAPAHNWDAANAHKALRAFASKAGAALFDVGEGVAHQVLAEGLVKPGELVVGADSHTTTYGALAAFSMGVGSSEAAYAMATGELWFKAPEPAYVELRGSFEPPVAGKDLALKLLSVLGSSGALQKALEFYGEGSSWLSVPDRLTVANMMVEAGADVALFQYDEKLSSWLSKHGVALEELWSSLKVEPDSDPFLEVELRELEPLVAAPPLPSNVKPVADLEGTPVDQVFIGSCTNGRFEDFEAAARVLRGMKARARLVLVPASKRVLLQLLESGLLKTFLEAGAVVGPPGCGPCFGAHMGVAGDGEAVVSTANRNFPGRAGPPSAKVFLASPYTAAAAAVEGQLTDPRRLLRGR